MKKPRHLRAIIGGKQGKGPPVIEIDADDITPEGIRAAFVARFGPECAAWLVWRFRKVIRRYGCFPMHLAAGEDEPNWFQLAIAHLRLRPSKWSVVVRTMGGKRVYRVIWLGGKQWGPRALPDSIRRF